MELEQLYKQIQPRVYAFFYVKTSSKEIAEDLTQEVFYEALRAYGKFRGQSTLQTWIFAIARNKLYSYYRSSRYKRGLKEKLEREEQESPPSPEQHYLQKEEQQQLQAVLGILDEQVRDIVTLRIYGELSFREIGELTGTSENYARVAFHRAKLKLHREMEGYDG